MDLWRVRGIFLRNLSGPRVVSSSLPAGSAWSPQSTHEPPEEGSQGCRGGEGWRERESGCSGVRHAGMGGEVHHPPAVTKQKRGKARSRRGGQSGQQWHCATSTPHC